MLLYNEPALPTVYLIAEYNTKTYINLQKLYEEYINKKSQMWGHKYNYQSGTETRGTRWRHFVYYRNPHTSRSLRNIVSKEEKRTYREDYPNTKLSLKNQRIKNLPTSWDDIPRNYYKSWKDCTKKKHKYD